MAHQKPKADHNGEHEQGNEKSHPSTMPQPVENVKMGSVRHGLIRWLQSSFDRIIKQVSKILRCDNIHPKSGYYINDRIVADVMDSRPQGNMNEAVIHANLRHQVDEGNRRARVSDCEFGVTYFQKSWRV